MSHVRNCVLNWWWEHNSLSKRRAPITQYRGSIYWIYWKHKYINRINSHILRSALFWDITRCLMITVYRRFGKTYRSHIHGSRVLFYSDSWPVKMVPLGWPETSVNNYHKTPRHIPEERRSHQHNGGSLKSRPHFNIYIYSDIKTT
jgi:hypothetical protein